MAPEAAGDPAAECAAEVQQHCRISGAVRTHMNISPTRRSVAAFGLLASIALPLSAGAEDSGWLGPVEAVRIATEAYIFGYPLVTFDSARRQQTNVSVPDAEHGSTADRGRTTSRTISSPPRARTS